MAAKDEIIVAQSTPNYDDFGIDDYWTCTDWTIWYTELQNEYGKTEARLIWRSAWENQDIAEHNYMWCGFDPNFPFRVWRWLCGAGLR